MNVREFGNAFKQAVANALERGEISIEKAQEIYPRFRAGDKVNGSKEMLSPEYDYNKHYPDNINNVNGSVVIDSWWSILTGRNDVEDDEGIVNNNNPFVVNLRNLPIRGDQLFDLTATLNHGEWHDSPLNIDRNDVEEWRLGHPNSISDAQAGWILATLFTNEWKLSDVRARLFPLGNPGNGSILVWVPFIENRVFIGCRLFLRINKLAIWRDAFRVLVDGGNDIVDLPPANLVTGTRGDLLKNGTPGSNINDVEKLAIIDDWLRRWESEKLPPNSLTSDLVRKMYSYGWEPGDINNNGNLLSVINPLTGANVDGLENILALGSKRNIVFLADFRNQGGNAALPAQINDAGVLNYVKHSPNNAHHLTGARAGQAFNNGWINHAEIRITNAGGLEVTLDAGVNWLVIDPTVVNRANVRFVADFRNQGGNAALPAQINDAGVLNYVKHSPNNAHHLTGARAGQAFNNGWINHAEIRITNAGGLEVTLDAGVNWLVIDPTVVNRFVADFRNQGGNAALPAQINDAGVLNYVKHSPNNAHHLTGARAGQAFNNGWINHAEIRITNAGGLEVTLDAGVNWLVIDPTVVNRFVADFRNQGGNAALPAQINDAGVLNYVKHSPNNAHHLTGARAGQAFNNGWINHAEIRITNAGGLEVTLDAGVNWLVIDPTVVNRFVADFRNQGGNAALPAQINDAGVLNYVKHSPNNAHHLTGARAGQAFNNGWINHAEIRITNAGGLEVTLDAGVNWLVIDPTVVNRFVADFRNQGGNAALPAQINDAGVLNYVKHSPNNAHHLTGARAGQAFNNGWINHAEIRITNAGGLEVTLDAGVNWLVIDPTVVNRFVADFRNQGGNAALPAQINDAGVLNYVKHSPNNAHHLTGARAGQAFNNGWINHAEIRITNAGGLEVTLDAGVNWLVIDPTVVNRFVADFRNQGGNAALPAQINDAGVLNYVKHSPNNAHHLTGARAGQAFNNGWINHAEIRITNAGGLEVTLDAGVNWLVIDPTVVNRFVADFRNQGGNAALPAQINDAGVLNYVKHSPNNAHHLTGARAGQAFNNGWINHAEIRITNAGGLEVTLDAGVNWLVIDPTVVNRANVRFVADFRNQGGNAALPAQINDAGVLNYVKHSPNNAHHLTGARAGQAFNNGWINHAEIRITNAGGLEVTLDAGVNWLVIDPTVVNRFVADFRNQGGNAALPAQINDAGVLNYVKHSPNNAHHLTGARAGQAFNNGWINHAEIRITNAGGLEVTLDAGVNWLVIDPTVVNRFVADFRNQGGNAALPAQINDAGVLNYVKHSPNNAHHLTGARAGQAFNNGWINHAEIRITNAGGLEVTLDAGVNWLVIDPTVVNRANVRFVADFRNQGGNAALPAQINDAGVLNYVKHSPNNAHHLTGARAGQAFNNGWINHAEIRITNAGGLEVTLDAGVNWLVIDPTVVNRFVADFRNQGGNAALPAQINDAGVLNYVKHSPNNAHHLTGARAGQAFNNGWINHAEIRITNAGGLEVTLDAGVNWLVIDPTVVNRANVRFVADFRNQGGNAALPAQINDAGVLNYVKHSPNNAHHLTGARAGQAFNNGWINHAEIRITNAGGLEVTLDAGVNWLVIDPTVVNRANVRFVADFRNQGGNAALPAQINDAGVLNYVKHSPNNAHHLTGARAGQAFNNGWINHAEIRITNAGGLEVTLDAGVNWLVIDPTVVNRFVADFRNQGGNAALPAQINDAGVLNYVKHSPNNAHHLTGARAGQAFNNGWINHAEIRITNAGGLEVTLDAGVNWLVIDPTVVNRFVADFRNQGGNAALPAQINDAGVLNYVKHSPNNAHHLTGARAGQAFNNGWINHAEIRITNAGGLEVTLDAGVNWLVIDPTVVNRANAQAWTATVSAVNAYWTDKLNKGKAGKKINNQTIKEILGDTWDTPAYEEIDTQVKIDAKQRELTDKIDVARKTEDESRPTTAEIETELFDVLVPDAKPESAIIDSYGEFQEADSKFKEPKVIKTFIDDAKVITDKKDVFVKKVLEKLPLDKKLVGENNQEKINNFFKEQKAETVIKAVFLFKLEDDKDFLEKAKKEIKDSFTRDGQELSLETYPKRGSEYTKDALVKFIFEKHIGQAHNYVSIEYNRKFKENIETPISWWARWGYASLWVPLLIGSGIAVWYFWDQITGLSKKNKIDEEN